MVAPNDQLANNSASKRNTCTHGGGLHLAPSFPEPHGTVSSPYASIQGTSTHTQDVSALDVLQTAGINEINTSAESDRHSRPRRKPAAHKQTHTLPKSSGLPPPAKRLGVYNPLPVSVYTIGTKSYQVRNNLPFWFTTVRGKNRSGYFAITELRDLDTGTPLVWFGFEDVALARIEIDGSGIIFEIVKDAPSLSSRQNADFEPGSPMPSGAILIQLMPTYGGFSMEAFEAVCAFIKGGPITSMWFNDETHFREATNMFRQIRMPAEELEQIPGPGTPLISRELLAPPPLTLPSVATLPPTPPTTEMAICECQSDQRPSTDQSADMEEVPVSAHGKGSEIAHAVTSGKKLVQPVNVPTRRRPKPSKAMHVTTGAEIVLKQDFTPLGPWMNLTVDDVNRLEPGVWLNDTLIEFGLRLCLSGLDPELAQQVHLFSSFFFQKINTKDKEKAFERVRKWTNRVDIFAKRYLIVPINEHHWYMLIVCHPERMLPPSSSTIPIKTTPRQVDCDGPLDGMSEDEQLLACTKSEPESTASYASGAPSPGDSSSVANADINGESCSLEEPWQLEDGANDMAIDDDADERRATSSSRFWQSDMEIVSDSEPEELNADPFSLRDNTSLDFKGKAVPQERSVAIGVKDPTTLPTDRKANSGALMRGEKASDIPWIFSFDSLSTGDRGKAAAKINEYLALEARAKRKVPETTPARYCVAGVPRQPNFSDCGVYLIHFFEIFMKNPERFTRLIVGPQTGGENAQQWDWSHHKAKTKRERFRGDILQLSEQWKASQKQG